MKTPELNRIYAGGKETWTTPTIKKEFLCTNCDGAPDGGHTGDIWCDYYENHE